MSAAPAMYAIEAAEEVADRAADDEVFASALFEALAKRLGSYRSTSRPRQMGRSRFDSSYPVTTISGRSEGGIDESRISTSDQMLKRYTSPSSKRMETCESRLGVGGRSISSSSSRADQPSQVTAYRNDGDVSVMDISGLPARGDRKPTPRDLFGGVR